MKKSTVSNLKKDKSKKQSKGDAATNGTSDKNKHKKVEISKEILDTKSFAEDEISALNIKEYEDNPLDDLGLSEFSTRIPSNSSFQMSEISYPSNYDSYSKTSPSTEVMDYGSNVDHGEDVEGESYVETECSFSRLSTQISSHGSQESLNLRHKAIDDNRSGTKRIYIITDLFLDTWCVRNGDGTKDLVLQGGKLKERIKRRLVDSDLPIIWNFLNTRPKVTGADLSYNLISDGGMEDEFIMFLKTNKTLKRLSLADNKIKDGIRNLCSISFPISLEELRLNGNKLRPEGGFFIAKFLAINTSIKYLDLGQTDQSVSSIAAIAARLNYNNTPTSVTTEYSKGMSNQPEDLEFQKKCTPHETDYKKEYLVNQMKDFVRWKLAPTLTKQILWTQPEETTVNKVDVNRTLKVIVLDRILPHYHHQFNSEHFARIIGTMIANNNTLEEIHLEKNSITDFEVEKICQGLSKNKKLKLINLASNGISNVGAEHIACCLKESPLEALILNHNEISNNGATSLSFGIPFSKLRFLDLAHNKIGDQGLQDILYMIKNKLLIFYIWGNPISVYSPRVISVRGDSCKFGQNPLQSIRCYVRTGSLLYEGMDTEIATSGPDTLKARFTDRDKYKYNYYRTLGTEKMTGPPQGFLPNPLTFWLRDRFYDRRMIDYIRPPGINVSGVHGSCTK